MTEAVTPLNEDLIAGLPGEELVRLGWADAHADLPGAYGLLLLAIGDRLRRSGLPVPQRSDIEAPFEHRLYEAIEDELGAAAHSRYNALLRRIVSFEHALSHPRRWETAPASER